MTFCFRSVLCVLRRFIRKVHSANSRGKTKTEKNEELEKLQTEQKRQDYSCIVSASFLSRSTALLHHSSGKKQCRPKHRRCTRDILRMLTGHLDESQTSCSAGSVAGSGVRRLSHSSLHDFGPSETPGRDGANRRYIDLENKRIFPWLARKFIWSYKTIESYKRGAGTGQRRTDRSAPGCGHKPVLIAQRCFSSVVVPVHKQGVLDVPVSSRRDEICSSVIAPTNSFSCVIIRTRL